LNEWPLTYRAGYEQDTDADHAFSELTFLFIVSL